MDIEQLKDGVVYAGGDIDPKLAGMVLCLTWIQVAHPREDFETWMNKERRKARRGGRLSAIQVHVRFDDEDTWTLAGWFGYDDELDYSIFSARQARALLQWLDDWCQEIGFCAPLPGSTCHRDAPPLP